MFGKKELNKEKSGWSLIVKVFFSSLLILTIVLVTYVIQSPSAYEEYSNKYIRDVKNNIVEVIAKSPEEEIEGDLVLLRNKYNFEVIVVRGGEVVYTSNNIYNIDYAQDVYDDKIYYTEVFQEGEYFVWVVIQNIDSYVFFDNFITKAMIIVIIMVVIVLIFVAYILARMLMPLKRLRSLVSALKTNEDLKNLNLHEGVDVISLELMGIANDMNLELHKSQNYGKEYQRRFAESKNLIEEQRDYLTSVVHSMKNPLSVIEFAKYILEQNVQVNSSMTESINSIGNATESLLNLVDTTLANVSEENILIYSETTDVNLKKVIIEYLETNNLLLKNKNLSYDIKGKDIELNINYLKVSQLLENVISNMIRHAKDSTELKIKINPTSIHFINDHDGREVVRGSSRDFSKGYGLHRIKQLSNEINIRIDYHNYDNYFEIILYIGE